MIEAPSIVLTEPLHYAYVRRTVPLAEMGKVMMPGVKAVALALREQGRPPVGAWFTHHLRRPVDLFDFEICFGVERPIEPSGEVQPGLWPAMRVARTVYHGDYAELPHSWGELEAWMKAEGHAGGTDFWERYTVNPESGATPAEWRTELSWPLV